MRFLLPPSLGPSAANERAARLLSALQAVAGRAVEVRVASGYDVLSRELLDGRVDAAWAPPFICARVEPMGARILVRGVRGGASTYRAALVCSEDRPVELAELQGKRAAWVHPDSVSGYLLPMALLKARGIDPGRTLFQQQFAGSFRGALEAVADGSADLASVFAPARQEGKEETTGLGQVVPELASRFRVIAFTEESPNDGVAVSPGAAPQTVQTLEKFLLALDGTEEGKALLKDIFNAERFDPAPKMAYRSLYRVALATL